MPGAFKMSPKEDHHTQILTETHVMVQIMGHLEHTRQLDQLQHEVHIPEMSHSTAIFLNV